MDDLGEEFDKCIFETSRYMERRRLEIDVLELMC